MLSGTPGANGIAQERDVNQVVLQARAEATRRRILDSAVDLFDELGYGETGLADVLQRANVSKGAFYYHFDSKEAVATAIIDDFRRQIKEATHEKFDQSAPVLDWLIMATFTSADMLRSEKTARIGNQLLQALSQISSSASQVYGEWTRQFVGTLKAGLEAVGVRDGVDVAEVAEATWAGVLGSYLLASAFDSDPQIGLARAWRSMVHAALPDEAVERYHGLIDRITQQFEVVV
jgi:AcrR family transcriptional regulator